MNILSKMFKFQQLTIVSLLFIFSACSEIDDPITDPPFPPEPEGRMEISVNLKHMVESKITDSDYENGDEVGLYVVNYSGSNPGDLLLNGNYIDNEKLTYNNEWTPSEILYWDSQTTKSDFYCYYPYIATISSIDNYPFTINLNQATNESYYASDFLWGDKKNVAPTNEPVVITMKHVMSNILVYLKPGEGYSETEFATLTKTLTICNTKPTSTINLSTGVATAIGEVSDIIPKSESGYYRALVVPQILNDVKLIKVNIGDDIFYLTNSITFEANTKHSCTITVNKKGEGIDIGIGDWENDNIDHGGIVE